MDQQDIVHENPGERREDSARLVMRIEEAYRIYKLSEMYLNNVSDDYGKQKIARLRLEFARHELVVLLNEAINKGIQWKDSEMIKKFIYPSS